MILATSYLAFQSFVIKVDNIPHELNGAPLFLKSQLDDRILDSIKIEGNEAVLTGSLDQAEWCDVCYSYPIYGGIRTYYITVFPGSNNDTIKVTITDYDKGQALLTGDSLNLKIGLLNDYIKSRTPFDSVKIQQIKDHLLDLVYENADNPFSAYVACISRDILEPQIWLDMYKTLSPKLTEYQPIIRAHKKIIGLVGTHEGDMFKDIQGINPDGVSVSLSDYIGKGKYVLVDFWASWCGPCRKEAQETLMPLYEKYKNSDKFMILGVMTSDKTEEHIKGAKSLNYPWPQLIAPGSVADDAYGFSYIPFIILIAPDGKILRRDIHGEEIWDAVEKALGD